MKLCEKKRLDCLCLEIARDKTVRVRQRGGRERLLLSWTTAQRELIAQFIKRSERFQSLKIQQRRVPSEKKLFNDVTY